MPPRKYRRLSNDPLKEQVSFKLQKCRYKGLIYDLLDGVGNLKYVTRKIFSFELFEKSERSRKLFLESFGRTEITEAIFPAKITVSTQSVQNKRTQTTDRHAATQTPSVGRKFGGGGLGGGSGGSRTVTASATRYINAERWERFAEEKVKSNFQRD